MFSKTGFSRRRFFYGSLLAGAFRGRLWQRPTLRALGYSLLRQAQRRRRRCGGQGGSEPVRRPREPKTSWPCATSIRTAPPPTTSASTKSQVRRLPRHARQEAKNIDAAPSAFRISCTPPWPWPASSAASTSTSRSPSPGRPGKRACSRTRRSSTSGHPGWATRDSRMSLRACAPR